MTRTRFHEGLDQLKERLLRMAGLAEQSIVRAVNAYRERDRSQSQLVFAGEAEINAAERDIDELALDLLAMQQPMAVDLRFILAVVKINSDLERVGDQAVNIAIRILDLLERPDVDVPVDIPRMAEAVADMVGRALESFLSARADLAQSVLEVDSVVDRMKDEAASRLLALMQEHPSTSPQYLDVLLIARNLERIADHATNIAEDVIFWVRGADVRHGASLQRRRGPAPREES